MKSLSLAGVAMIAAGVVASCGGDSLEDGWDALSAEDQAAVCELFNSDVMDDATLDQIVAAANEADGPDVTADEFRDLLQEQC